MERKKKRKKKKNKHQRPTIFLRRRLKRMKVLESKENSLKNKNKSN